MIDVTTITKVYSGKAGKCCCGCSGNYRYATGKAVHTHDKVNDNQVKKIVNLLNANPDTKADSNHYWVETDGRLYIAYTD